MIFFNRKLSTELRGQNQQANNTTILHEGRCYLLYGILI